MLKVAIIDSGIDWDILKNNEVIDSKSFLYKNKKIEINDNLFFMSNFSFKNNSKMFNSYLLSFL